MGNTVGSLSEAQQSIVIGSLLGDGSMRCKTNALLEINHSAAQEAYVWWKYHQLAELVRTPPVLRAGNGGRVACRFVTRSLPELTPHFLAFYRGGRKSVPEDVILTPLTLAIWVMDDGCISRTSVYLNTQQFDLASQEQLMSALWCQWGIRSTLNRDRTYRRIRVSVAGTVRLIELVSPFMRPELRYKLPQVTP